jgi:hypothetical protein
MNCYETSIVKITPQFFSHELLALQIPHASASFTFQPRLRLLSPNNTIKRHLNRFSNSATARLSSGNLAFLHYLSNHNCSYALPSCPFTLQLPGCSSLFSLSQVRLDSATVVVVEYPATAFQGASCKCS